MNPSILRGIKVHPENPFKFDFILDQGDAPTNELREESTKLIQIFLAGLTIPDQDLWLISRLMKKTVLSLQALD